MILLIPLMIVGFAAFLCFVAFRRWIWSRLKPKTLVNRCVCGYEMDQLDTIRCPECGRVQGFEVTAEELELTPEQLRLAKEKRESRRRIGSV